MSNAGSTTPEGTVSARKIPASGGGSRKDAKWSRRRVALQALVFAVLFAILNTILIGQDVDPLWFVVTLATSLMVLFVLFWFWLSVTSRRERNALIAATPLPPSAVAPRPSVHFTYTGRTWRVFAVTFLIDVSLFFAFLVSALFAGYPPGLQAILLALSGLMAAMIPFVLALLRRRSFTIDDSGMRCSGRLRSNFDLHWQNITEIDVVEPPSLSAAMPAPPMPPVYAILGQGGSALAVFSPQGEFGAGLGDAMERALLEQAASRGIKMGTRRGLRGLRRKKALPTYP